MAAERYAGILAYPVGCVSGCDRVECVLERRQPWVGALLYMEIVTVPCIVESSVVIAPSGVQ